MWAASDNISVDVLNLLIAGGADLELKDPWGNTVLARSSQFNTNPQIIQNLIDQGSDKSIENKFSQTAWDLLRKNDAIISNRYFDRLEQQLK